MFLQAQRVPRRCNCGFAQQNGTNGLRAKGGKRMIEVYIDGSSKGNPGPGGAGIVIKKAASQELLERTRNTAGTRDQQPSGVPCPQARAN